jgi:phosphate transport system substrate-binding protein
MEMYHSSRRLSEKNLDQYKGESMRIITLIFCMFFATTSFAQTRDQIRIVGSSTVYPFTTTVAENFGRSKKFKTPIVESTGTGGGLKLFCNGVGPTHPDAVNASRVIKKSEFDLCQANGVTQIIEIKIGFDGLTIAQAKNGPNIRLSLAQVFLALAENVPDRSGALVPNPHRNWSDIEPSLPNVRIEVLGPPPTSGTRDSFHELFMEPGAEAVLGNLKKTNPKAFETAWKSIRKDGAYVEAGENDNVIIQKLQGNRNAFGIFGFSFLDENTATIRGVSIDGVEPTMDNISSGKYKGARELFVYVKGQHIASIPGLREFAEEYVSSRAIGDAGYLTRKGLVALPKNQLTEVVNTVKSMVTLRAEQLK